MPRSHRYRTDDGLPGTLRRSCREAQDAFTRAYEEAVQLYGKGDRAYRAAFTALKQGAAINGSSSASPRADTCRAPAAAPRAKPLRDLTRPGQNDQNEGDS